MEDFTLNRPRGSVFFQGTHVWGEDFHRSASMFQMYILIHDMSVSGQQTAKRALIGIISNICYMKNRAHKWYRISLAFYDKPGVEATQYYQNLKLCQFLSFFQHSNGKDKRVLYPGNYYLRIYPLSFSRLLRACTHLARRILLASKPAKVRAAWALDPH